MSETTPSYVTPGMTELTPYLICDGAAAAIDFYVEVFGAEEIGQRFVDADGKVGHADLRIGRAQISVADVYEGFGLSPADLPESPVGLSLYVADVDAVLARAEAAGGTVVSPVEETFYGARRFRLRDPFGHRWMVATHVREVTPEEYQKARDEFAGTPSSDVS
jgi:PhnB protein